MRSAHPADRCATLPWGAWPSATWFAAFLLAPAPFVLAYSLAQRGTYGGVELSLTWENYARTFDWIYLKILRNSVKLASVTTISCLALGFPTAYVIATSKGRWKNLLLFLVVVPFWTNFVVRAYAVKLVLEKLGLPGLATGDFAVWIGMVTNYLPFMVLPIFVSLEKFDFSLMEAARDLGASRSVAFWRILIPLNWQGILSGTLFVFTPALGEFVIPDLLGGARTMLAGNLITDQFLKSRDWPFGSAVAVILIIMVLALVQGGAILATRFKQRRERNRRQGAMA